MKMARKAVFLDRDGVINTVIIRDGKPTGPRCMREFQFEPEVTESIERLRAAGYMLFIVTNQPDVVRGLMTAEALQSIMDHITGAFRFDGVRACLHDDSDNCECRKPRPGMILDLARQHGVPLEESWMIGDSAKDTLAAGAAGCRSIILDRSYNQDAPADYRVNTLGEAVNLIIAENSIGEPANG